MINMTVHRWDTAGQERFKCITQCYYRKAHGEKTLIDMYMPMKRQFFLNYFSSHGNFRFVRNQNSGQLQKVATGRFGSVQLCR
jgi:hypothetical protein